ncbi:MAG: hypothetical protein K2X53_01865 [Alphaproteobacteria bacterium]|nr:hypothetical protein [Alphaproteobacteria bacterium]
MKRLLFTLILTTTLSSAGFSSVTSEPVSKELSGFLDSIKNPSISKNDVARMLEGFDHPKKKEFCQEVKGSDFTKLAADFQISTFKRNAITMFCESYVPPKEHADVSSLESGRYPKASADYQSQHREVGTLKLPTEIPNTNDAPSTPVKPRVKIQIPSVLIAEHEKSQQESIANTRKAIEVVASQIAPSDAAELQKLAEVRKNYDKAEEDFNTMGMIIETLRESIEAEANLFPTFKPHNHKTDTHEAYLEEILKHPGDIANAKRYNKSGELDQLDGAKRMLDDSKLAINKARAELREMMQ